MTLTAWKKVARKFDAYIAAAKQPTLREAIIWSGGNPSMVGPEWMAQLAELLRRRLARFNQESRNG